MSLVASKTLSRLLFILALAPAALPVHSASAEEKPLMQGPHPFRDDHEVTVGLGLLKTNFYGAMAAQFGYGYQIQGGLWLDLRLAIQDVASGPGFLQSNWDCPGAASCYRNTVDKAAELLAGISYRLQMNVPVVPYGKLSVGPMYYFPKGTENAMGFGIRPAIGATYHFYERFGLGAELGLLAGSTGLPDALSLKGSVVQVDLGVRAVVQFGP